MGELDELFTKIRVDFLFSHPFLSVLALSLPHRYVNNDRYAIQTNGRALFLDRQKLTTYSPEELKYLYAHALLHVALKHPLRQKAKDDALWNGACDIVVNLILSKFDNIGIRPTDEVCNERFEKMIAEEVYERLREESGSGFEQKDIDEEQRTETDEFQDETDELDALLVQALSIAKSEAAITEGFLLEIAEIIKPDLHFDDVFREYFTTSLFEKIQSFTRPNRRFIHSGIYLPGYERPKEFLHLYIALDSSMSVTEDEYRRFLGVCDGIAHDFFEYTLVIVPFDSTVNHNLILRLSGGDVLHEEMFKIPKTDGGTDITPVIEYMYSQGDENAVLAVLSDGYFEIPTLLPQECVFFISERKNLARFENVGKTIWFNL